jgi:hypothetical protein
MTLEYFRQDLLGAMFFALGQRDEPVDPSRSVHVNYPQYALRAFYSTMQDIQELEYSKGDIVPDGRNAVVASTYWYLTLESYLNSLLKLACLRLDKAFKLYSKRSAAEKLSALLELLALDDIAVKKTGIYNRIHEFTEFRNEIFHDRNTGQVVTFRKTLFCPIPIQCNLIDTLQGLLILLETTALLRYAIAGLDTMPDILINANGKTFHKKLDLLFEQVLKPSFQEILLKHKLFTNLQMDIEFPEAIRSALFSAAETNAYIIPDSPQAFQFHLNPETTDISFGYFSKLVDSQVLEPDKFDYGRYMLDN